MPIYDYKCPKCGKTEEINCSSKAIVLLACCDQVKVKQISIPSGIHFKGSGFYETDYKDKG
jgi:putative FmdB family regulatory protein